MSVTLDSLLTRIELLEEVVYNIQVALTNVASTEAVRQINLIRQQDINDILTDIVDLRNRIELINNEVFK